MSTVPSVVQKKLRITEGTVVTAVNAPSNYAKTLGKLPRGSSITTRLGKSQAFIHLFVKDKAELEREVFKVAKALAPEGLLWISYPKGAKTDLTRDKGWESLEKLRMQWLSSISFDDTWSAFLMKNVPPKAPNMASKEYQENSAAWADPMTKIVRLPEDLEVLFKNNAKAKAAFEMLAYTNKKEYVLWIVGAKREGTRIVRVAKTMEKLLQGKKNPSEK